MSRPRFVSQRTRRSPTWATSWPPARKARPPTGPPVVNSPSSSPEAASTEKIRRARAMLDQHGGDVWLEVDGGITLETIVSAHRAGADTFVAGSAVFGAPDPAEALRALRRRCTVEI